MFKLEVSRHFCQGRTVTVKTNAETLKPSKWLARRPHCLSDELITHISSSDSLQSTADLLCHCLCMQHIRLFDYVLHKFVVDSDTDNLPQNDFQQCRLYSRFYTEGHWCLYNCINVESTHPLTSDVHHSRACICVEGRQKAVQNVCIPHICTLGVVNTTHQWMMHQCQCRLSTDQCCAKCLSS